MLTGGKLTANATLFINTVIVLELNTSNPCPTLQTLPHQIEKGANLQQHSIAG